MGRGTGRGGRGGWAVLAAAVAALSFGTVTAATSQAGASAPARAAITGVPANFWLVTPSGGVEPYGVPSYGAPTGPCVGLTAIVGPVTRNAPVAV